MDAAALITAAGRARTMPSAATRSMSSWSTTATSPGCKRVMRFFVRRSTRAGPDTGVTCSARRTATALHPCPFARRGREELFGVVARRRAAGLARQHAAQLHDARVVVERRGGCHRAPVALVLLD